MHKHRFILFTCLAGATLISIILIYGNYLIGFLLRDSSCDNIIEKFKTIQAGDSLDSVVAKLGEGHIIHLNQIPKIPSIVSTKHADEPAHLVPVVEGDIIFVWELKSCQFYIAFDKNKIVIERRLLNNNDL